MAASWPRELPPEWFNDSGPTYTPADNTIRTSVSAGPAKLRRRFTAQTEELSVSNQLSEPQLAILERFVKVTLGEALSFAWKDFRTGKTAMYRFKAGWSSVVTKHFAGDLWDVTLTLEMLP